jgi:hypothetical protein
VLLGLPILCLAQTTEQAAKAQSYAQRQQAKDFGKSILAQGIPYASDLFDGYGDYNQKMDALMAQINPARMNSAAVAQGLTGDALRTANQAFAASRSAYNPILALAEANKSVISRPGAFQEQCMTMAFVTSRRCCRLVHMLLAQSLNCMVSSIASNKAWASMASTSNAHRWLTTSLQAIPKPGPGAGLRH